MEPAPRSRPRRRWQPMRRIALSLMGLGISSEMVAILGMVLGILAGFTFLFTGESSNPSLYWGTGMICCILRIICVRLDELFSSQPSRAMAEEVFVRELPERVSDAVTLIGFGFAMESNYWLGLATALAAIFSAYVRSLGEMKGASRKSAGAGPMNRAHRLMLLSTTSFLMIIDIPRAHFRTPIPQIALWVILFGCVTTILIRWLKIQKHEAN